MTLEVFLIMEVVFGGDEWPLNYENFKKTKN